MKILSLPRPAERRVPRWRNGLPFSETGVRHPGTPEEREYQIIGVLADHEIGQPSDIATEVVPG